MTYHDFLYDSPKPPTLSEHVFEFSEPDALILSAPESAFDQCSAEKRCSIMEFANALGLDGTRIPLVAQAALYPKQLEQLLAGWQEAVESATCGTLVMTVLTGSPESWREVYKEYLELGELGPAYELHRKRHDSFCDSCLHTANIHGGLVFPFVNKEQRISWSSDMIIKTRPFLDGYVAAFPDFEGIHKATNFALHFNDFLRDANYRESDPLHELHARTVVGSPSFLVSELASVGMDKFVVAREVWDRLEDQQRMTVATSSGMLDDFLSPVLGGIGERRRLTDELSAEAREIINRVEAGEWPMRRAA